jgi:mRNA-degrading endonuclease toxin of MazEF toxin-antitoxin module
VCPRWRSRDSGFDLSRGEAQERPATAARQGWWQRRGPYDVLAPLKVGGAVLSDQVKSLDWRVRKARLIGRAPAALVDEVTSKLLALLR